MLGIKREAIIFFWCKLPLSGRESVSGSFMAAIHVEKRKETIYTL